MTATPAGYVKSILYEPGTCKNCGNPADDALCIDCLIAEGGVVLPQRTIIPIPASDFCAQPDNPAAELVGPLVQAAGRTIIVGQTGEGKTTLAMQLIRVALSGDPFLDWHGIGSGSALVVDLEQGVKSAKRSLREAGLADRDDVDLALIPDGLALDKDPSHISELDEVIDHGRYTIVTLDPFYKAHQADDPNAERPIVDLMRILDALRAKYGFALILPAHPRKEPAGNNQLRKLTLGDVSGSSAITRGAEIVLGIERVASGYSRIRFLKDRDGDLPIGEHYNLTFSREHGFTRDQRDLEPARDYHAEILERAEDGEWRTVKEWKEVVNAGQTAVKAALTQLVAAGKMIYREGPPGRKAQAKCWRLKRPDDDAEYQQMLAQNDVTPDSQDTTSHNESQPSQGLCDPTDPALIGVRGRSHDRHPTSPGQVTSPAEDDEFPF